MHRKRGVRDKTGRVVETSEGKGSRRDRAPSPLTHVFPSLGPFFFCAHIVFMRPLRWLQQELT